MHPKREGFGSWEFELVEFEKYGRKEQPGAQSSVRVRNITNRYCVLRQCNTFHIVAEEENHQLDASIYPQEKQI